MTRNDSTTNQLEDNIHIVIVEIFINQHFFLATWHMDKSIEFQPARILFASKLE